MNGKEEAMAGNTRIMTLAEFDEKLDTEAQKLREALPGMRADLRNDPEGCFGGRGNNIGTQIVENAENRLGWLTSQGYSIRAHPWIDMLQAGIDLSTVEKVAANERGVFIYGTEGNRRIKQINSNPTEVNWMYDRKRGEWRGEEPPAEVIAAAEAIAAFHESGLLEWRGEFHVPRVYL